MKDRAKPVTVESIENTCDSSAAVLSQVNSYIPYKVLGLSVERLRFDVDILEY